MGDFITQSTTSLTTLHDQCQLLQNVMHDVLRLAVGDDLDQATKWLALSKAAVDLHSAGDEDSAQVLLDRQRQALQQLPTKQATFVTRMCGHYLNLTAIAEQLYMVRCSQAPDYEFSHHATFERLLRQGASPEDIYEAVCKQTVEVVLTAHPTQTLRRSLQHKQCRIGHLLSEIERAALIKDDVTKDDSMRALFREVMATWQTDELRRKKPTPVEEARGGLHILEQSLWNAVPTYLRHLSAALHTLCGQALPLECTPVRFGSWMGGDRDGNPNVTAKVTRHVALLSRWIAADLYAREIDLLQFELSMPRCTRELSEAAAAARARRDEASVTARTRGTALPMGMVIAPSRVAQYAARHEAAPILSQTSGIPPSSVPQDADRSQGSNGISPNGSNTALGLSKPSSVKAPPKPKRPEMPPLPTGLLYKKDSVQTAWPRRARSSAPGPLDDFPSPGRIDRHARKASGLPPNLTYSHTGNLELPEPAETYLAAAEAARAAQAGIESVKGSHPYRDVLADVVQRLRNTKLRMEALLAGQKPDDSHHWIDSEDELAAVLRLCYDSLTTTGCGMIADGRLLDIIRRLYTFGLTLLKMDVRQESTRHSELLGAITRYLDVGDYASWSEEEKCAWLKHELASKRPLLPPDLVLEADKQEVLDTFRAAADLGPRALGAYVISMASRPSDVLAVVLLQKEAHLQSALTLNLSPELASQLRVVPLFETLADLSNATAAMDALFSDEWYREHLRNEFDDCQEVMLGYSDSGKDAGRLAANWALYQAQEGLVEVARQHGITLTLFHGRGGSIGRGGGPMHIALLSQPAGSVQGGLRITEQGEMVHSKFGAPGIAVTTLEHFTTAVLEATLCPPSPPRCQAWRGIMDQLGSISCEAYRDVVFRNPTFLRYFRCVTPEGELGNLNIGSRPTRRKAKDAGVGSLRAIPWIFAWTQTRHILPSWLGVGEALAALLPKHGPALTDMMREWPFFSSTIGLIEMTLAKADMNVASAYDSGLVKEPELLEIGQLVKGKYYMAVNSIKALTGHNLLCEDSSILRSLLGMRRPYLDPANFIQVEVLRRLRDAPEDEELKDLLLLTVNGVASGMRNTG